MGFLEEMRRQLRKPKEYRRECGRCPNVWYMPRELVEEKAPPKLAVVGARMEAAGALLPSTATSRRLRVGELEGKRERVLQNSRCPACGSTSFAEEPIFD